MTQRCDLLTDHGPDKCQLKIIVSIVDTWSNFNINWNNIEGATSPASCELPHQCIYYKQCITGKFASHPPDHSRQNYGSPGRFVGRIWRQGDCICAALLQGQRIFVSTAIKLNIIRSMCYRVRVWSHVLLSGIQIVCVLHFGVTCLNMYEWEGRQKNQTSTSYISTKWLCYCNR